MNIFFTEIEKLNRNTVSRDILGQQNKKLFFLQIHNDSWIFIVICWVEKPIDINDILYVL